MRLSLFVVSVIFAAPFHLRADDLETLKKAGVATDDAGLLAFFKDRTLSADDAQRHATRIESLASKETRDAAQKELIAAGPRVLGLIRAVLEREPSAEIHKQLEVIRAAIEKKAELSDAVGAAARLVTQRNVAGNGTVLWNYLPSCPDEQSEEDILALLAQRPENIRLLEEALKDTQPARRAAAAYALARFGGPESRAAVRALAVDPDPIVRARVVEGFVGKVPVRAARESLKSDQETLQTYKIDGGERALLEFFKGRTRSAEDLQKIVDWIADLGNVDFRVRDRATAMLVRQGPAALPFLRDAESKGDPEMQRRAYLCAEEIRRGPGPELPIAAARVLTRSEKPAEILPVLLAYVPFADNETVADELHQTLTVLSARLPSVPAELAAALHDARPARRAAAAVVLGRIGQPEQINLVREALKDEDPAVRVRAAQGLLAANDTSAVARLIDLIPDCPGPLLWQIDETLLGLAGDTAPNVTVPIDEPALRPKAKDAWTAWLKKSSQKIDLASWRRGDQYQGIITICEYDGAGGRPGSKVWQRGRDGRVRWIIDGLQGPMYAQPLPNGRVLIAENNANRVIERDLQGNVVWDFRPPGNPIVCQRLANGNTFIGTYNHVLEVTPDKKVLYSHNRGPAFYLFSAERTRDGRIVCLTAQGQLIELEASTGKELKNFKAVNGGGWCSVQALPNERYLISSMGANAGEIREIDATGKILWQTRFPGVFRAVKLPNGNILAASMTTKKVAEIDREGRTRWEVTCGGRPWSLCYR